MERSVSASMAGSTAVTDRVDPGADAAALIGGLAAFAAGARAARRPGVGLREREWFAKVNGLPAEWHAPVWVVMQLGSLGGVAFSAAALHAAGREDAARQAAAAGTLAWAASKGLKQFIGRGRPAALLAPARVLGREQSGLGYPSGHAAVTAAMAYAADGTEAAWLVPLAVGSSRLYVGAHLPLDVAGGVALGIACGAMVRLAESAWRHLSSSTPTSSRRS